jgi:hypothetical protein
VAPTTPPQGSVPRRVPTVAAGCAHPRAPGGGREGGRVSERTPRYAAGSVSPAGRHRRLRLAGLCGACPRRGSREPIGRPRGPSPVPPRGYAEAVGALGLDRVRKQLVRLGSCGRRRRTDLSRPYRSVVSRMLDQAPWTSLTLVRPRGPSSAWTRPRWSRTWTRHAGPGVRLWSRFVDQPGPGRVRLAQDVDPVMCIDCSVVHATA